jgi:von Willebrand factor A domain-containing protein 8
MEPTMVQDLIHMAALIPDGISLQSMQDAVLYLERNPNTVSSQAAMNAYSATMLSIQDLPYNNNNNNSNLSTRQSSTFVETKTTRIVQDLILSAFESGKRGVAVVGPKGCYKSAVVRELARQQSVPIGLFSLYSDMTARDLLLTRGTDVEGNTVWRKTPLTRAIETGTWVILDGIDKVSVDTLTSLALLMEQGQADLPDGTRLRVDSGFRCIALAHPVDSRNKWLSPEVVGMFHFVKVDPLPAEELIRVLSDLYPKIAPKTLENIVLLRDRLDEAIRGGAADSKDEQESLLLSMRKLKHVCKRIEQQGHDDLATLVENAMMIDLMPDREQRIVRTCMADSGIIATTRQSQGRRGTTLDEEIILRCRRVPKNLLLVPNPVFEENPGHAQVLVDILAAHSVGEEALLIMGFQGVGKNRVIDHLLSRLACEREYLQLHRDTTVQSLLSSPSVEEGRIVYNDSPLVRAAKHGRILVIDEADKAPVEVVALLKGLIEDRELVLPDGRTLRYKADFVDTQTPDTVAIHPDFRIWALANPASYPFHGNNISGEMSDVFSCHTVPPLDAESQRRILQRYGPDVSGGDVETIISIWQDLRASHEKGIISYPFSVREAVSVTKHLNRFPADGLDGAFENVIAFDRFNSITLKQLAKIFDNHGIMIAALGSNAAGESVAAKGGISTPRTRASSPKHGKIDEDNDPHVGGNTWAGGSGGSDTAGLGGRGGPYRLDSGHPVHQVSDEMKAQVSQEALRKARQMAREALQLKLKELNMNELDWEKYNHLQERVAPQIQQLRVLLRDIKRRKQERTWLKRQSTGELDDSRLVDAMAGEKDVFKKRGHPSDANLNSKHSAEPMAIKLVVDISASMYRFNGFDGRLQTLLEATLMIMEALKDDDRFSLTIVGHNGDSPEILLFRPDTPKDPKTQLKVLESMVAYTQYTFAGDHTVEAVEAAVSQANEGDLILVISDANLRRYRIDPSDIGHLLTQSGVHAHLVLIGNFGEEARQLSRDVPNERAQVCLKSEDLPLILKTILASAAK